MRFCVISCQLLLTQSGITRLLINFSEDKKALKIFPKAYQDMLLVSLCKSKNKKTTLREHESKTESLHQLANVHLFFNDLPLIVIAAGKCSIPEILSEEWLQYSQKYFLAWQLLQNDLVTRSSKGKLIIAENSDHMIPFNQPEIIVSAIKQMLEE